MPTISGGDDVQIVRIAGLGDPSTGYQYTFSDRPVGADYTPPAGAGDPVVCIRSAPVSIKAQIRPLATVGQVGGVEVELALIDAPALAALLADRSAAAPVAYLTAFVDETETDFPVSSTAGFAVGQSLHVGREVCKVTALPGGGIVRVSRGFFGTTPRAHAVGLFGAAIYLQRPSYRGAYVTISRWTAGTVSEVVRYRGVLQGITVRDGLRVVLSVDSLLGAVTSRAFTMPYVEGPTIPRADVPFLRGGAVEAAIDSWDRDLMVDGEQWGTEAGQRWTAAAWVSDDRWVVLPVTYSETVSRSSTGGLARRLVRYTLPTGPLHTITLGAGDKRRAFTWDRTSEAGARDWVQFVRDTIANATRVVYVPITNTVGAALQGALTGFGPWGAGLDYPAEFLDPDGIAWPFALNAALPQFIENADANPGNTVSGFLPPIYESTKDLIKALLGPLLLGLTARSGGRLALVDWGGDERERGAVIDLALYAASFRIVVKYEAADAVPAVAVVRSREHFRPRGPADAGGESDLVVDVARDLIVSELVSTDAVLLSPRELPTGPLWAGERNDAAHRARVEQIVYQWATPPARVDLELAEGIAWDVGDVRVCTHPHLIDADGTVSGTAAARLMVVQRVPNEGERTETVQALLLGYVGTGPEPPTWAAWGRIESLAYPWTVLETNVFTDPNASEGPTTDVAAFVVPPAGAVEVEAFRGNVVAKVATGDLIGVDIPNNRLRILWSGRPPPVGSYVRLSSYDATGVAGVRALGFDPDVHGGPPAFLADAAGTLGLTNDPAGRYR